MTIREALTWIALGMLAAILGHRITDRIRNHLEDQ